MTEKEVLELIIIFCIVIPLVTIIWFILFKDDGDEHHYCGNLPSKNNDGNLEGPKVMTNRFGEICVTSVTIEVPCPLCGSTRATLLQHSSVASCLGPNYRLKCNVCRIEFRKTVKEVDEYNKNNKGST